MSLKTLFDSWTGMLPCQMTVSCLVICTSFVATPNFNNKKGRPPVLTVQLVSTFLPSQIHAVYGLVFRSAFAD